MHAFLVGDKSRFAIETYIARPYECLGQLALGYFILYVGGQTYGVQSADATMLACSFDAVSRRLSRRGMHIAVFGSETSLEKLVQSVHDALYEDISAETQFWDMSIEEFINQLITHEIILAPDGDAAFDDGSQVLQFDMGDDVRLVAFKNSADSTTGTNMLVDVKMDGEEFYKILKDWRDKFNLMRHRALSE